MSVFKAQGLLMGLYKDNGKEKGNYHLGFRVLGLEAYPEP